MAGNKRYVTGKTAARDVIRGRADTVKAQHPYVMVLCCSDSRVSPELIFDQNIGDLFVVRTAGNVADPIALASLEYAVDHLDSRMLVVLGHENCGAVSATLSGEAQPSDNLTALVKKIRPGVERLKDLVTGDALMVWPSKPMSIQHCRRAEQRDTPAQRRSWRPDDCKPCINSAAAGFPP
jgi:carbonic anhydrase